MTSFVRTQEIEHEIGPSGSFALRVSSADVELRGVEGSLARVRVTFTIRAATDADADAVLESARFRLTASGSELEVSEPKRSESGLGALAGLLGMTKASVSPEVHVELPASARVRVEGVSADVVATGLRGPQDFRTVSGDLVLEGGAGEIRLRGVSGDVSLRADGPLSDLEVNTVSGDVSALAPRIEQLRIVTVSGDVEIEGELADGPGHRVETVSGDLTFGAVGDLTVEVRGLSSDVAINVAHRSEGSRDRRRYVIGNGGADLLFSSMSGDASIGAARRIGHARVTTTDGDQLQILQALERGEIDVEEAARRLAGEADA
ncbi:MAG: DUF4097 family beta strand repeat-containing protein [Candidatus Limnocylindria bacterium]